jgi:hypothetical protein
MTEEIKEVPLKEKIDTIFNQLEKENTSGIKIFRRKKMKLLRKSKVRRMRRKKGWIGILRIDENGNISGEKQKIEDSTLKLKDGTYHSTDGSEVLFWEGKFPVLVQETRKKNPVRFNSGENQTYGQKYIIAKMLKDTIKVKPKLGGGIIIWIVVAIALFFGAKYIFKF